MPIGEPRLWLEGEEILLSDDWEGDSANNSAVWIPSIKVACATDIAFHDCHLWPIESNVARRVKCGHQLRRSESLARALLSPATATMKKYGSWKKSRPMVRDPTTECIDWSLRYLDDYEEVFNTAKTGAEMVSAMTRIYPDVKAEDFAIHWQARLLFPRSSPDWLTPLPGNRAGYFLAQAALMMAIRRGNSLQESRKAFYTQTPTRQSASIGGFCQRNSALSAPGAWTPCVRRPSRRLGLLSAPSPLAVLGNKLSSAADGRFQ